MLFLRNLYILKGANIFTKYISQTCEMAPKEPTINIKSANWSLL